MQKNSATNGANGKNAAAQHPAGSDWEDVVRQRRAEAGLGPPQARPLAVPGRATLGRAALIRHPALGRGARAVAALIVGTYEVDERYVIVQAFPIGRQPVQFADVQLLDSDPGETNEAVAWLVS
jgi:hypothetical protein